MTTAASSLVNTIQATCAEVDVNNLAASIKWAKKYISAKRLASIRRKAHSMIQQRWLDGAYICEPDWHCVELCAVF